MKRLIVSAAMIAGVAGIAFASMNATGKKETGQKVEKKMEKKKKECKRPCLFNF